MSNLLEFGEREPGTGADVFIPRGDGLPAMYFNFPSFNEAMDFARSHIESVGTSGKLHVQNCAYGPQIANLENGRIVEANTHSGIIELMNSECGAGI